MTGVSAGNRQGRNAAAKRGAIDAATDCFNPANQIVSRRNRRAHTRVSSLAHHDVGEGYARCLNRYANLAGTRYRDGSAPQCEAGGPAWTGNVDELRAAHSSNPSMRLMAVTVLSGASQWGIVHRR